MKQLIILILSVELLFIGDTSFSGSRVLTRLMV